MWARLLIEGQLGQLHSPPHPRKRRETLEGYPLCIRKKSIPSADGAVSLRNRYSRRIDRVSVETRSTQLARQSGASSVGAQ